MTNEQRNEKLRTMKESTALSRHIDNKETKLRDEMNKKRAEKKEVEERISSKKNSLLQNMKDKRKKDKLEHNITDLSNKAADYGSVNTLKSGRQVNKFVKKGDTDASEYEKKWAKKTKERQKEFTNNGGKMEESAYTESLNSVDMSFEVPPVEDFFMHINKDKNLDLDIDPKSLFGETAYNYRWKLFGVPVVLDRNFSKRFVENQLTTIYRFRDSIFSNAYKKISEISVDLFGKRLKQDEMEKYFPIDHIELSDKHYTYLGFGSTVLTGPYKKVSFIMCIKDINPRRGYLYVVKESTFKKKK